MRWRQLGGDNVDADGAAGRREGRREEGGGTCKQRHTHITPSVCRVPSIVQRLGSVRRKRRYDLRNQFVLQHARHIERVVAAKRQEAVEG